MVWLTVAVTVALGAALGALRAAARSWGALALQLVLLLGTAGVCYLISETKNVGFLAGIIGVLCSILLLIAAAGLSLGALGRWIYDRTSSGPVRPTPMAHWDIWLLGLIAALAVLASAVE